jgi:hypothetical protein
MRDRVLLVVRFGQVCAAGSLGPTRRTPGSTQALDPFGGLSERQRAELAGRLNQ